MYPGIPSDYPAWPTSLKKAWIANHLKVKTTLDKLADTIDESTPEGVYNATLELTGDEEQARLARRHKTTISKLATLPE